MKLRGFPYLGLFCTLAVALSHAAVEQTQPVAAAPKFPVWEYRVLGNTVLTNRDIEAVVYPHLGPDKSLALVEELRKALEELYKERGFGTVFVDIPEQNVGEGIVRLRVTEGKLDRVRISGARYFSNGWIRQSLPALAAGQVLSLTGLQTQLAALNQRTPDRQVTPVLRAGRTPGTVDIDLKVKDELPLHASAEVNDRYTASTSKTRVNVNLSYDNLFQKQHSLSLQYQTAPQEPGQARVIAATYVAPSSSSRNVLALYAVDTNSDVAALGTLSVLGAGRIYGARYIVPLPNTERYFQSFTFGADFKDFKENVRLTEKTGLQTPIQYANWSLLYGGNSRTANTLSSFNVGFNFGLRALANSPAEFEDKRFKARPNYIYFRMDGQHERPLLFGSRLFVRLAGQYTAEPLISNEQFAIGGADSVRGYLESDQLGDYGISGSLEVRSKSLASWLGERVSKLYVFSFVDGGVIGLIEPLPQQDARTDLSSWGLGLRFEGLGGFEAALDWATPLVDSNTVQTGDSRLHFRVRYAF